MPGYYIIYQDRREDKAGVFSCIAQNASEAVRIFDRYHPTDTLLDMFPAGRGMAPAPRTNAIPPTEESS